MCLYLWIIRNIVDVLLLFCLISCTCDRPVTMLTMCVSFVFVYFTLAGTGLWPLKRFNKNLNHLNNCLFGSRKHQIKKKNTKKNITNPWFPGHLQICVSLNVHIFTFIWNTQFEMNMLYLIKKISYTYIRLLAHQKNETNPTIWPNSTEFLFSRIWGADYWGMIRGLPIT